MNDLPNCSDILKLRIFADDTKIFASHYDLREVGEGLMNSELRKVKRGVTQINYQLIILKRTL